MKIVCKTVDGATRKHSTIFPKKDRLKNKKITHVKILKGSCGEPCSFQSSRNILIKNKINK